jgi:hypothetical protein
LLAQLIGGLGHIASPLAPAVVLIWTYAGGALAGAALVQVLRRRQREAVQWWGA